MLWEKKLQNKSPLFRVEVEAFIALNAFSADLTTVAWNAHVEWEVNDTDKKRTEDQDTNNNVMETDRENNDSTVATWTVMITSH